MWGEYLSGIRKGEHDSALYGWMSDNGDPDNFANTLLGCDSIKPALTPRAGVIKSMMGW
jgi:ABC-type oligopeptide transport system substrate-binding subunit